jgi:hypothetical protein
MKKKKEEKGSSGDNEDEDEDFSEEEKEESRYFEIPQVLSINHNMMYLVYNKIFTYF